jgi:capsular polysaccharide biosynthesis protein
MDEEQHLEGEISLNDIWRTIRRRLWLILIIIIIAVAGSHLYLGQIVPLFKSTSILLVQAPNSNGPQQLNPYSDYSSSERWTQTYAQMIESEPVLKAAVDKIIYPKFSIGSLKKGLTVEAVRNTLLLKLSFSYTSATYAKKVVDTIAQVFTEKTKELYESNIQASTQKLETQISQLDAEIEKLNGEIISGKLSPSELEIKRSNLESQLNIRGLLNSQLQEQKLYESQISPTVKVYQEGSVSYSPDNIKRTLTYSIAGVLGIFIGVLIAFILEYLDDTIKTEEDIKRIYKLKVLGVIPRFTGKTEHYYSSGYSKGRRYSSQQ